MNRRLKPSETKAAAKVRAAIKYRDPKTGATWSGHGRAPSWIATAKNRDKFLVDASAATVKTAHVSKAKGAGNYVRGPQPSLYRDPKSGATWSGRGRSPAWLAGVKDRTRFLIDGTAAAPTTSALKVATEKAPTKKAGAKKAVAKKAVANKAVVRNSPTAEAAVAASKAPKKSSGASKKVVVKKTVASRTAGPAVKKVAAKKALAVKAATANTEAAPMPEASVELSA